MLTTGVRTPVGIKVFGSDINVIERIGTDIESLLPKVQGTLYVFAERTGGGYFLDFDWNRAEVARYGLSIDDVQAVVMSAVGGENVTTTIEGSDRAKKLAMVPLVSGAAARPSSQASGWTVRRNVQEIQSSAICGERKQTPRIRVSHRQHPKPCARWKPDACLGCMESRRAPGRFDTTSARSA